MPSGSQAKLTTAPKARRTAGLHGGVTCRPADTIVFAGGQKLERRHAPGKNESEYLLLCQKYLVCVQFSNFLDCAEKELGKDFHA
ncbi:hypothetical protein MGG_17233 [Pyricularia oryzae 70-15]|uniref:Uncharacterized protein n=1 Tax=Pyricularia oryzae (strain 70-15 / ATCC MYA-4617 / FGSC 8958) TaxID=242507 RepID=G4N922_PYRO7|nr:uncharacterized protein MGG_17233 [Pyricularia oryzae 70-15]EHA51117.1 hypothetical protein MGG_17233 [Pyricularia oryzae 70-15]